MLTEALDRRAFLWITATGAIAPMLVRPAAAQEADATRPVGALNAALVSSMRAGRRTAFGQRFASLAPAVDYAFDLPAILRVSIGPRWSALSPDAQNRLDAAFRRYTVANYVANFDSYHGEQIGIVGVRTVGADRVVDTQVAQPGDAGDVLSYVMRATPAGWRAIDVLANGAISRVAVQRSDFRSLLARGGGEALLASLERKVSDLSGGSLA